MNVIVKLQGGLANQMFQYSFGKFISNETGRELILDLNFLKNREIPETDYFVYRNYDLDVFDIVPKMVDSFEEEYELIQEPWDNFFNFRGDLVEKALSSVSDNIYLDGYWASFRYFTDGVSSEFVFRSDVLDESRDLMEEIRRTESVMIHVRRTDFLSNPLLLTIGEEYIKAAVRDLGGENKRFYIFSDDPDWCKDNLSHIGTVVGKEHNGFKNSNYLRLMTNCKYFIVSNSTFGWWCAYLSKRDKAVIYPSKVFKDGYPLVPEGWHPLEWKGILI